MTKEREALKLALEALEMFCEYGAILKPIETRDAIKEALAQEKALQALHDENECIGLYKDAYKQQSNEQVEPVAWIVHDRVAPDRLTFVEVKESLQTEVTPLYKHPPVPTAQPKEPEQEPVAWMVTSEMQDGTKNTYPLTGRFKDVKDVCDFGNPVPLYTKEQL